jgi:PAS domain S-box-containing protein
VAERAETRSLSKDHFEALFDLAPDGYVVTDLNGTIKAANRAFETITGRRERYLISKPLPSLVDAGDRRRLRRIMLAVARDGRAGEFDLHLATGDGSRLDLGVTIARHVVAETDDHELLWMVRDLSEARRAEGEARALAMELELIVADRTASLEREREQLATLVANMPVGVLLVELPSGKIVRRNQEAAALFRDEDDSVWALRAVDSKGNELPADAWSLPSALSSAESVRGEVVLLELPDGSRRRTEITSMPVVRDREAIAAVLVLEDVTERDRRERAERDFVTNAAHELQTPIAAITSGIQVLQSGAKEHAADRDRFLAHIEAACARLDRLTRALLVLARAQAGHEHPAAEVVEIEPLLRAVSAALPPHAQIELQCPRHLAVIANRVLLEQALVNLGSNAVKYTTGRVLLSAAREDGRVRLEVRDQGAGIDPEERERVFDRVYRGTLGDGFGLGLAIVAEAVRAINGELQLDSTDEGTGVSIKLPAANIVSK